MGKLTSALIVAFAFAAIAASGSSASPGPHPLKTRLVEASSGPGHAPNEPLASVSGNQKSYQHYLGTRQLSSVAKACTQHTWHQKYDFTNPYGIVLFSYYEQVYYCRDGVNVTYFYRYRWHHESSIIPYLHYSPWQFDGNVPSGNDCANEHCFIRGYKASQRSAVTEGKFETCLIPYINLGCNYDYPVIRITVYGDGSKPDSGWSD
jgi:hypothetical protein